MTHQDNEGKTLVELEESECRMLMGLLDKVRDLHQVLSRMHDTYVAQAAPPDFDRIEAAYLLAEDVLTEMERYLLPECDPYVAQGVDRRGERSRPS